MRKPYNKYLSSAFLFILLLTTTNVFAQFTQLYVRPYQGQQFVCHDEPYYHCDIVPMNTAKNVYSGGTIAHFHASPDRATPIIHDTNRGYYNPYVSDYDHFTGLYDPYAGYRDLPPTY